MNYSLLIIDDEESIRDSLSMALGRKYDVSTRATGKAALGDLDALNPDIVLLDIGLPDVSGLEVLDGIRRRTPHAAVIMITAFEDLDTVISAMKRGAFDYLVKPLRMDALKLCLERAGSSIRLGKEIRELQDKALREHIPFFVAESEALTDVVQTVAKVAVSPDTPVLIEGATGTGKELVASAIHHRSPNFRGPLVTVNCAAMPGELIESGTLRVRPWSLQRSRQEGEGRTGRGGGWREPLPGRNRGTPPKRAGQAPALPPAWRVLPPGLHDQTHGADTRPGCDEPQPRRHGRVGRLPPGPLFPPGRGPHPRAVPDQPQGGYPAAGEAVFCISTGKNSEKTSPALRMRPKRRS